MDNVPDPTDFPPEVEAPGLRRLDSAFSCQICGEVYDAPMILNCGHSFCSMCVRRSLRDRHECPSCRNPAEEVNLVKNVQLEDLCDSWRSARDTILRLIEKADSLTKATLNDVESLPRKRRKPSMPTTPGPSTERGFTEIIDDSDVEMPNCEYVPSSDVEENKAQMQMNLVVDCPICSRLIVRQNINEHIDSGCKSFLAKWKSDPANARNAWNNILRSGSPKPISRTKGKKRQKSSPTNVDGATERLPKPPYDVLKDKKIREMLSECQLPTTGSRAQLIARHTQFVLLYNANLDRAEHLRRTISDLRKEIRKWEDNAETKRISVDDTRSYVKDRNAEFKKHIEAAKASLRRKARDSHSVPGPCTTHSASKSETMPDGTASYGDASKSPAETRPTVSLEKTVISDSEGEDVT